MCSLLCIDFYPNANKTQIVLHRLHLFSSSYFGKFGFLFKDYESIFSKCDVKSDIEVPPTQRPLRFLSQHKPQNTLLGNSQLPIIRPANSERGSRHNSNTDAIQRHTHCHSCGGNTCILPTLQCPLIRLYGQIGPIIHCYLYLCTNCILC